METTAPFASTITRWNSWDGALSTFTIRLRRCDYEALPTEDARTVYDALKDIEDVFARSATAAPCNSAEPYPSESPKGEIADA